MKPLARAFACMLCVLVLAAGCQKNDQSAVQPERLPGESATAPPLAESATAREHHAKGDDALPSPDGTLSPDGPLVPYAGKQPPTTTKGEPAVVSTGAPPEAEKDPPAEVKLLEAGKEPRKALRLHPAVGQVEELDMKLTMALEMIAGDQKSPPTKLPPMQMIMSMKVKDVAANGDIRYEFTLTKTDVLAGPGTEKQVVEAMKGALSKLDGMSGEAVVTDRGFTKDAKFNLPPGADDQTKTVLQGMEQALQQIGAPLPEEPVGPGAKWRFTTRVTQNGIRITQSATYELTKIAGDLMSCKVTVEQSAPKQKVPSPLGVTVDLLSLKSQGDGTSDMELTHLAPRTSVMKLVSAVRMALPKGEKLVMNTTMIIDMRSPAKAAAP
jgi:hypothetical protein